MSNRRIYKPATGQQRNWLSVIRQKRVEAFLRKNSRRNLAEGVPQIFIVSQDHISNRVLLQGVYERGFLDAALAYLRQNGLNFRTAVDAGANIGNHSLYFASYYKKVFSFEPNPVLSLVLRANAEMVGNIETFETGLSDHRELRFYRPLMTSI